MGGLSGCGKPVSKSELAGTYVADFGVATDTLTIEADGHFTQTIKVKADSKTAISNGTWRFDQKERIIRFSTFMRVIDGVDKLLPDFDNPKTKSPISLSVRRLLGKLELGGDDLPWGRRGLEAPYTKLVSTSP